MIQVERITGDFYLQMYECLPNRPVVGTVGQPFSWLLIQCTVTGVSVKCAGCGDVA